MNKVSLLPHNNVKTFPGRRDCMKHYYCHGMSRAAFIDICKGYKSTMQFIQMLYLFKCSSTAILVFFICSIEILSMHTYVCRV